MKKCCETKHWLLRSVSESYEAADIVALSMPHLTGESREFLDALRRDITLARERNVFGDGPSWEATTRAGVTLQLRTLLTEYLQPDGSLPLDPEARATALLIAWTITQVHGSA